MRLPWSGNETATQLKGSCGAHLVCLVVTELEEVDEEGKYFPRTLVVHVPDAGYTQRKGLQGQRNMICGEGGKGKGARREMKRNIFPHNEHPHVVFLTGMEQV